MIGKSLMKKTLPEKEKFYSNLNMEDITDTNYIHEKKLCKDFEIKNLSEYHDLYLKIDTLVLVDIFENFRKVCLSFRSCKISFISCISLASSLKKDRSNIGIVN